MKQAILSLLALITLICAVGCTTQPSPKDVAENFFQHMKNQQFKEAKGYCTEDGKKLVEFMEKMQSLFQGKGSSAMFDVKVAGEEIHGNEAIVTYNMGNFENQHLKMKKENGEWLVAMSLTDLMQSTQSQVAPVTP